VSADDTRQEPATRGHLRIYLGVAPGAGATCALLSEGQRSAEHGTDVVVAIAQTHGRPRTEALLKGLGIISPARVACRDTMAEELDPGAALAPRPAMELVDDLAHSNAPGLRHAKRWQDVEDLLAAGIDVVSTVSIERLDSVSDVAGQITGASPAETAPDLVASAADEVELVDVAPETLRDRMACGHIYPAQRAETALGGWCQVGNLSALREIALLWLAAKLTRDSQRRRDGGGTHDGGKARERAVVALGGGPAGERLIRRAARIAARSGGGLLAVHAAPPGGPAAARRAALAAQQQLTWLLGGTYHQLADDDIPAALLTFARAQNATQLVLGTARRPRLTPLRPGTSTRARVIRRGGGISVHIVTCAPTAHGVPPGACEPNQRRIVMKKNASWPDRVRPEARRPRGRAVAPGQGRRRRRMGWLASAAVVAAALIVAACASSGSGSTGSTPSRAAAPASGMAASGSALKTTTINGATVLANAEGFAVYSFAPRHPDGV
jgi:two-component system sensor histidine kinase KdpD